MGYSNNKWRKILTILMIINLCFILFAKISKVFASFTITNYTNNEVFNISDTFINKYPYYAFLTTSNGTYVSVVCSNSPITTNATNSENFGYYTYYNSNNTGMTAELSGSYVYVQNTLNGSNLPNINKSKNSITVSSYGAMSVFYTNHDIKNNTSGDTIYNDNSYTPPNFDNITEIESGYPDGVFISRGSYSADDYLYFHLLKITNTVPDGNQSTYYYESKIFKLRKDTKYYRTYPADTEEKHSYYYITRSQLTLDTNSSYLYVLSNNSDKITSSYGILQPDIPAGIYDVIASDTAGVITEQDAINDKMANINETQQEIANSQEEVANNSNNINNFLTENTVSNNTNNNIDTSLNFDNSAPQFSSLFNGYFSRLTSIISDLGNYQDTDVITISIPIPFTNNTIPISSNFIFANQNNTFLKNLATTLWYFIFGRYFLYFLINIYWLIANGQFFENYLTQKEVITGDML